jgi:hypothetical protein
MADLKISALTASTTPLAGTEVLPIVQSSTTKQVSVANLTAGRAVSSLSITTNNTGYATPTANFQSGDQAGARVAIINSGAGGQTFHLVTGNPGVSNSGFALYDSTNSATRLYVGSSTGDLTLNTGNLVQGTAAKGINFTANTPAAGMTSQLLNWYEAGTFTPTDGSGAGLTLTNNGSYYTRIGRQVNIFIDVTYPVTASASAMLIKGSPALATMISDGAGNIGYTTYVPAAVVFVQVSTGLAGVRIQTNGGTTITNAALSTQRIQISASYFVS